MILKVNINMPENTAEIENKASKVVADILVKKLQTKEVEQLIEMLKDENFNIKL